MNDKEPDIERLQAAHSLLNSSPKQATKELEALSELGSAMAPLYLGWIYCGNDDGAPQNSTKAEYWLRQSLDRGEMQASYYLGHLYSRLGRYEEANAAYEHGSAVGYSPSTYCLAMNILEGKPEPKNLERAKQLLETASNQGHAFALRSLASLYLSGQYGWLKIGYGLWLWLRAIARGVLITVRNVDDDNLRA